MSKQSKKPMALDDTPKGRKGIEEMLKRMSEIEDKKNDDNKSNKETA